MTAHRVIARSAELAELAEVIGEDAVLRLCEALGGTRTYVPKEISAQHPLGRAIDAKTAARLAEFYHGRMLDLPKAYVRRERALELVKSGGMTIKEAALQTDYSQRHLRRLRNAPDDSDQLTLPF